MNCSIIDFVDLCARFTAIASRVLRLVERTSGFCASKRSCTSSSKIPSYPAYWVYRLFSTLAFWLEVSRPPSHLQSPTRWRRRCSVRRYCSTMAVVLSHQTTSTCSSRCPPSMHCPRHQCMGQWVSGSRRYLHRSPHCYKERGVLDSLRPSLHCDFASKS